MAKRKSLKIQMLGGFFLEYDGKSVIPKSNGKNKVLYLLEYLITNRHRAVPQNELIDILLGDEEGIDPGHTLKNLVYRARKILSDAGLNEKEYIYFHNGAYGFSQKAPSIIDVEEFEKNINLAENSSDIQVKLKAGLNAANIYKGDFLPYSYQQPWAIPAVVKYQNLYFATINMVTDILLEKKEYEQVLNITEKSTTLYPYNEDFYIRRISALQHLGNSKGAIREYESASAMIFDELGVSPSQELYNAYMQAAEDVDTAPMDIHRVLSDIMEDNYKTGAFYCNYYMFSNICQYMIRFSQRTGQSGFLIMCTFTDKDGKIIEANNLKHVSLAFHKSMSEALRQSDIYTRCRPAQFLILLMGNNQENSRVAIRRVEKLFKQHIKSNDYHLNIQYTSETDISRYVDGQFPFFSK